MDVAASHIGRLGCSEIAAAIGVSPWKTPYQVWEGKTGRAKPADLSGQLRIGLGHRLEEVVADLYCERTGFVTQRSSREYVHPDLPLIGHIDRRVVRQRAGLEIKTSLTRFPGDDWGDEMTDQIPLHYLVQCMGYLMLTKWSRWDVAVLLAGPEMKIYTVLPDPDAFAGIEARVREFWRHVETDEPPAPITLADAGRRWPRAHEGSFVEIPPDVRSDFADLKRLKQEIADLSEIAEAFELAVKAAMGEAEWMTDGGRALCSWKNQATRRVDLKRLKAEYPDVYESCLSETRGRAFRLAKEKPE